MLTSIILVFIFIQTALSVDQVVEVPNGKILGHEIKTYANTTYYAFNQIPYAEPPVGVLRFQAPRPAQKWDGILNATLLAASCYQIPFGIPSPNSEDCLYLSVYTPQLPGDDIELLPVMFYIHGGGFTLGSGLFGFPDLFVDNGVILVSINYRLGPFGFLSTEDEVVPGNNGLKDQLLAITWTHDNIHLFGGDPEKITIFGQSAGSISVSYHLLNQNANGLFRAAIMQSGTAINQVAAQRNARSAAYRIATILEPNFSNTSDSQQLLEFLQSVDANALNDAALIHWFEMKNAKPWEDFVAQELTWAPVIEVKNPDAIITRKMYGLVKGGNVLKVPIMIGFDSEEGLSFIDKDPTDFQNHLKSVDENLDWIVPNDMQITDPDQHAEVAKAIRDIYTGGEPFSTRMGDAVRYCSDNIFNRGMRKFAEFYSSVADTFFYQFSYSGITGSSNISYDGADKVAHSEEGPYLFCFGEICNYAARSESDQITSNRLITMWTNFAKYLNPTPEPSELLQNVTWPKVSTASGDFLYLDINQYLEVRNNPKEESLRKWFQLYDSLNYTDFDTY